MHRVGQRRPKVKAGCGLVKRKLVINGIARAMKNLKSQISNPKSQIGNDKSGRATASAFSQSARRRFWRRGEPWVWATAAALAGNALVGRHSAGRCDGQWTRRVLAGRSAEVTFADGSKLLGRIIRREVNPDTGQSSVQLKTANRELDPQRQDFRWIKADAIRATAQPAEACVLERIENGDFYGYVKGVAGPDLPPCASPLPAGEGTNVRPLPLGEGTKAVPDRSPGVPVAEALSIALDCVRRKSAAEIAPISAELFALSHELHESRDKLVRLKYRSQSSPIALGKVAGPKSPLPLAEGQGARAESPAASPHPSPLPEGEGTNDRQIAELEAVSQRIKEKSDRLVSQQQQRLARLRRNVVLMSDAVGRETPVALADVVRFYQPNAMGFFGQVRALPQQARRAALGQSAGIEHRGRALFPAIFGTVMLIFLMAVTCFPLGVLTGIYLGEYAKDGLLVRLVRIAVNNLAGIPSIVYGIFGLGFFVYGIGGQLDQWFFPERVAAGTPTFGTGGILWASLTLGLLTVPVVIVATEEALRAIPRATREGSFALGATKFQTSAARAAADGFARHDDRFHPGDGPGRRRGGAADDHRGGETGPADAG